MEAFDEKQLLFIIIQLQQKVSSLEERIVKLETHKPVQRKRDPPNNNNKEQPALSEKDAELYSKLKTWRFDISKAKNIQSYRIASNVALTELAQKRPKTKNDALECNGIGKVFVDSYWTEVGKIINEYS